MKLPFMSIFTCGQKISELAIQNSKPTLVV